MSLDTKIFYSINHLPHNKISDLLAETIHYLTYYGWVFALPIVYFFFTGDPLRKLLAKQLVFSMVLAGFINDFVLRPLVMRGRPFTTLTDVVTVGKLPGEYSFPSGHAAIAFAFATTYFLMMPKGPTGYIILLFAGVVALGRIYMGFHYPSDVIFGVLLGVICAFISVNVLKTV